MCHLEGTDVQPSPLEGNIDAWTVMWPQLRLGSWVRGGLSALSILACYGPAVYTVPRQMLRRG